MSDKKEDFGPTEQTTMSDNKEEKKKKKKKIWRIMQNGRWFKIDKVCTKESGTLRLFYGTTYLERESLNIRRSSILKKALDFCKKRGDIKTTYAHDQNLLLDKLKEFDSDFLKQMNEDDAIDLIDAAAKLEIKSLFNLLFEDVVNMISHKTPEEIAEIFTIRYKKGDDKQFKMINLVMDGACWPLEKVI